MSELSRLIAGFLMFKLGGPVTLGILLVLSCFFNSYFVNIVSNFILLASSFFLFELGTPLTLVFLMGSVAGASIISESLKMKRHFDVPGNPAIADRRIMPAQSKAYFASKSLKMDNQPTQYIGRELNKNNNPEIHNSNLIPIENSSRSSNIRSFNANMKP